jgi:RNA methyltransferase, TrmH family
VSAHIPRDPSSLGPGEALVARFQSARTDPSLAVLEGFHPIKHALRFGAQIDAIVTREKNELFTLAGSLAPDIHAALRTSAREVDREVFASLAPSPPDTGVIAIARRRSSSPDELLAAEARPTPAVLLERPAHRGNVGAVIRVSAAAGASAVISTGQLDPWDPAVIRGSAGLHYAIDVARAETLDALGAPLIALDPRGAPLDACTIPSNAVLAFGSERRGLSDDLLARADAAIAIPMQPGVSSLNLATAVAVVLYAWRLRQSSRR